MLKAALVGTTLNNDMGGSLLSNAQIQDISESRVALVTVSGSQTINYAAGSYYTVTTSGSITLAFSNFSAAGTTSRGSNVAYAAAKAGIDALTRSLALHMAPVRVLSVSPGAISTNFVPNPVDKYYEMMARTTPLRRVTSVVDVAATVEACVMLLRFCSGIVITVDGARHVWR